MDTPPVLLPSSPRLLPTMRTRSPSRSPTRMRSNDGLISDLSPTSTLEAFTSQSGKLRASIEAASESDRAFGIRAAVASKKIQEWVDELSGWLWPAGDGSTGFEMPAEAGMREDVEDAEYFGSLTTVTLYAYENRLEEITEDMKDLKVEEIKRQVLDSHFSAKSRPSSSASSAPMPTLLAYAPMDDFTAIVTATVLQTLPNLSRLVRLMERWGARLDVLQNVPHLIKRLAQAEIALRSGWEAIEEVSHEHFGTAQDVFLTRETFEVMRNVLQTKVMVLGQALDRMLDTLEGSQDTLPDSWLERMEDITSDYGEWAVAADRKVRLGQWTTMLHAGQNEGRRLTGAHATRQEYDQHLAFERNTTQASGTSEKPRMTDEDTGSRSKIITAQRNEVVGNPKLHTPEQGKKDVKLIQTMRTMDEEAWVLFVPEREAPRVSPEAMQLIELAQKDREDETYLQEEALGLHQQDEKSPIGSFPEYCPVISPVILPTKQEVRQSQYDSGNMDLTQSALWSSKALEIHTASLKRSLSPDIPPTKSIQPPDTIVGIVDGAIEKSENTEDMGAIVSLLCCSKYQASDTSSISNRLGAETANTTISGPQFGLEDTFEKTSEASPKPKHISPKLPELDLASTTWDRQRDDGFDSSPNAPSLWTSSDDDRMIGLAPAINTPTASPLSAQWMSLADVELPDQHIESSAEPFRNNSNFSSIGQSRSTFDLCDAPSFDTAQATYQAVAMASRRALKSGHCPSHSLVSSRQDRILESIETSSLEDGLDTPSSTPPRLVRQYTSSGHSSLVTHELDHNQTTDFTSDGTVDKAQNQESNIIRIYDQVPRSSSPMIAPTLPRSETDVMFSLCEDEGSPSLGRDMRHMSESSSPPSSPLTNPKAYRRRSSLTASEISEPVNEATYLEDVDIPNASASMNPQETSTDAQIQQQISSILDSIPSDIRLTTSPLASNPAAHAHKIRRSTRSRAPSSLSACSPTPYLTLAPVQTPQIARPRTSPEVKVYQLSRSTGEKPIKLLVRLVGEHGERVMVRVGGGWADLGEYLKEYASHHGRRPGEGKGGKVEIHDLGRSVSGAPSSSPASAIPGGIHAPNLAIRKHRVSVGMGDKPDGAPFTPVSGRRTVSAVETPDSGPGALRLSWGEDEGSLGLAGPRGRMVELPDWKQEWVDSMKQKVMTASAEKEDVRESGGSGRKKFRRVE